MWLKGSADKYSKLTKYGMHKTELRNIAIYPTMKCNMRCKMCHIWGESGWATGEENINNQLDINTAINFLEEARKNYSKFWVMISGGEPTLYKNLPEILRYLKKNELPVMLLTNGLLLNKYTDLILETVSFLFVSIDGPPAVHDSIRGITNGFNKISDGILNIIKLKKDKQKTPVIFLNYVISEYSQHVINEYFNVISGIFASKGLTINLENWYGQSGNTAADVVIGFEPRLFISKQMGEMYEKEMMKHFNCKVTGAWKGFLTESEVDGKLVEKELLPLYHKQKVDVSNFVNLPEYFKDPNNTFNRNRCMAPWYGLVIRPDGEVYFCPDHPDYEIGNIHTNSFNEIWNGEKAVKFREVLNNKLLPVCSRCCRLYFDYDWPMNIEKAYQILDLMNKISG